MKKKKLCDAEYIYIEKFSFSRSPYPDIEKLNETLRRVNCTTSKKKYMWKGISEAMNEQE